MKMLLLISAMFATGLAQPAMANTCHDCGDGAHAAVHAKIEKETAKARAAGAQIAAIADSHADMAAKGWPCEERQKAVKVAMKAAAEAITKSAGAKSGKAQDWDCEDCDNGLCTEAAHHKVANGDCVDCVDQARIV